MVLQAHLVLFYWVFFFLRSLAYTQISVRFGSVDFVAYYLLSSIIIAYIGKV